MTPQIVSAKNQQLRTVTQFDRAGHAVVEPVGSTARAATISIEKEPHAVPGASPCIVVRVRPVRAHRGLVGRGASTRRTMAHGIGQARIRPHIGTGRHVDALHLMHISAC